MAKERDYAKEYREYQGTPEQIKRRASRNAARRKMVRAKRARKGDGKDVDHKDGNPMHNGDSNLRVVSKETNRAKKALLDATRLLPIARALIALAQTDAPDYRPASEQARCASCAHFDGSACRRFDFAADADYICDDYDGRNPMQELKAFVEKYGARNSQVDQAAIQDAHDLLVRLGAMCVGLESKADKV